MHPRDFLNTFSALTVAPLAAWARPAFAGGYLTLPDGPGLGVSIRKDLIATS